MQEEISKNSIFGIASIAVAILAGTSIFTVLIIAGYLVETTPDGIADDSPIAITIGLLAILLAVLNLVGISLGLIGIFEQNKKKLFAVIGTTLNLIVLLGTAGAIIMGHLSEQK